MQSARQKQARQQPAHLPALCPMLGPLITKSHCGARWYSAIFAALAGGPWTCQALLPTLSTVSGPLATDLDTKLSGRAGRQIKHFQLPWPQGHIGGCNAAFRETP